MKRIICFLFNHKYALKREVSIGIREIYCKRCNSEFAMNDFLGTVLPMDPEFRRLHEELIKIDKEHPTQLKTN